VSAARLAAHAVALLGTGAEPIAVVGPRAPRVVRALGERARLAADDEAAGAAVVVFLGTVAAPAERQQALRATQRRLPPGAPLLLVDHNQPRVAWRRALALVTLAAAGLAPARARYPAARELAALGFAVERLRLACGERVQLVLARHH